MSENKDRLPTFDQRAVQRSFDRAAESYDEHAVLQREVAQRLQSRLEWLKIEPQRILDLGAGTGEQTAALQKRYPRAQVLALDLSSQMLRRARKQSGWFRRGPSVVCADSHFLPLADQSVDMVFSSLSLQWCDRPELAFAEIRRVLNPDGVLLFSTFGPDTLKELRASWAQTAEQPHVHAFLDMHDIGDLIVYAGLQEPVMEREEIVLTYGAAKDVMRDLQYIGAVNALSGRSRGLLGRQRYQEFCNAYESWRQDGRLPATYEVVYGTAWSGQTGRMGMASINIEDIGRKLNG